MAVAQHNSAKLRFKICLSASAGGHITQLLKLAGSWDGHETFCVTTTDVVRGDLQRYGKVYTVGECNREYPLRVIRVLAKCIGVIMREKPDVVISTGAAVGCIMCFLGRLLGAKIIWLDSITNVERISLSGRLVRPIADLFLVQWPKLAEKYHDVEYTGAVV